MLNVAVLMGRLTDNPTLKVTTSGKDVCSFSIAVDRMSGGKKTADFINITAWGSTAVFVEKYFRKGSMISLNGKIRSRNYEDKNGSKRTAFEVVAEEVYFCEAKRESAPPSAPPTAPPTEPSLGNGYFSNATYKDFEEITDDDEY